MGIAEERAERSKMFHEKRKALIENVKQLKSSGLTVKEIAEQLGIKEATVLICQKQA